MGVSGVLTAWLLRGLIDAAVSGSESELWKNAALLGVLTVCQLAARAASRASAERARASAENALKGRLFSALLRRDYSSVTEIHTADWLGRLTSDAAVAADGITGLIPEALGLAARLTGAAAMLLVLLPEALWALLPGGIITASAAYGLRRVLKKLYRRIQEADGRLRVFITDRLSNLAVVRAFSMESEAETGASMLASEHAEARIRRMRWANLAATGFAAVMRGAYLLGAVYCGHGILTGAVSYGTFTATLSLVGQVQAPFANISGLVPRYYAMLASAERLLEAESFPEEPVGDAPDPADFEGLGMDSVSFRYGEGRPEVLRSVSFGISRGERVAVTGPSGCGKSTLLKLLLALYAPESGSVYVIAGGERRPVTPAARSLFAYVPQGNQLMSGTIREALCFSGTDREDAELWKALEAAEAADFVRAMPHQLDTRLGDGGQGVSEGQRQRLAIARALVTGRPVIILDEATGSLDEATEERLLDNLAALRDRTVIAVTHRRRALLGASRVYTMEEGTLTERHG